MSLPQTEADSLWASSTTMRSHSLCFSFSLYSSFLARMSMEEMQKGRSLNGSSSFRIRAFRTSKSRENFSFSSSFHCSASPPGQTMRQRFISSRTMSSLISRPVMMVLPAPGSSASRNRNGIRGSISWYTAEIWCGNGWIPEVSTARNGSKLDAFCIRSVSNSSFTVSPGISLIPSLTTDSFGSSYRNKNRRPGRFIASLYCTERTESPCHFTFSMVTASGSIPSTRAPGRICSSFSIPVF